MRKLIALLLIPCLFADPACAAGLRFTGSLPVAVTPTAAFRFDNQALMLRPTSMRLGQPHEWVTRFVITGVAAAVTTGAFLVLAHAGSGWRTPGFVDWYGALSRGEQLRFLGRSSILLIGLGFLARTAIAAWVEIRTLQIHTRWGERRRSRWSLAAHPSSIWTYESQMADAYKAWLTAEQFDANPESVQQRVARGERVSGIGFFVDPTPAFQQELDVWVTEFERLAATYPVLAGKVALTPRGERHMSVATGSYAASFDSRWIESARARGAEAARFRPQMTAALGNINGFQEQGSIFAEVFFKGADLERLVELQTVLAPGAPRDDFKFHIQIAQHGGLNALETAALQNVVRSLHGFIAERMERRAKRGAALTMPVDKLRLRGFRDSFTNSHEYGVYPLLSHKGFAKAERRGRGRAESALGSSADLNSDETSASPPGMTPALPDSITAPDFTGIDVENPAADRSWRQALREDIGIPLFTGAVLGGAAAAAFGAHLHIGNPVALSVIFLAGCLVAIALEEYTTGWLQEQLEKSIEALQIRDELPWGNVVISRIEEYYHVHIHGNEGAHAVHHPKIKAVLWLANAQILVVLAAMFVALWFLLSGARPSAGSTPQDIRSYVMIAGIAAAVIGGPLGLAGRAAYELFLLRTDPVTPLVREIIRLNRLFIRQGLSSSFAFGAEMDDAERRAPILEGVGLSLYVQERLEANMWRILVQMRAAAPAEMILRGVPAIFLPDTDEIYTALLEAVAAHAPGLRGIPSLETYERLARGILPWLMRAALQVAEMARKRDAWETGLTDIAHSLQRAGMPLPYFAHFRARVDAARFPYDAANHNPMEFLPRAREIGMRVSAQERLAARLDSLWPSEGALRDLELEWLYHRLERESPATLRNPAARTQALTVIEIEWRVKDRLRQDVTEHLRRDAATAHRRSGAAVDPAPTSPAMDLGRLVTALREFADRRGLPLPIQFGPEQVLKTALRRLGHSLDLSPESFGTVLIGDGAELVENLALYWEEDFWLYYVRDLLRDGLVYHGGQDRNFRLDDYVQTAARIHGMSVLADFDLGSFAEAVWLGMVRPPQELEREAALVLDRQDRLLRRVKPAVDETFTGSLAATRVWERVMETENIRMDVFSQLDALDPTRQLRGHLQTVELTPPLDLRQWDLLVEKPAQRLVRAILAVEGQIFQVNAYGAGWKGVVWKLHDRLYFTPLTREDYSTEVISSDRLYPAAARHAPSPTERAG